MSKKLLFLFVFFLMILAGFMYLQQEYGEKLHLTIPKYPIPTPTEGTTVSFTPETVKATPGVPTQAEIVLQTVHTTPEIVQLELAYDPLMISNVAIVPGDYFTNPSILLNTIDINTGRISYALQNETKSQKTKPTGTIAIVYFTPLMTLWEKDTSIYFLPKTAIKDAQENNLFSAGYGLKITKPAYIAPSPFLQFQPIASTPAYPQR